MCMSQDDDLDPGSKSCGMKPGGDRYGEEVGSADTSVHPSGEEDVGS